MQYVPVSFYPEKKKIFGQIFLEADLFLSLATEFNISFNETTCVKKCFSVGQICEVFQIQSCEVAAEVNQNIRQQL